MEDLVPLVNIRRHLQELRVADISRATGVNRMTIYKVRDGYETMHVQTWRKLSAYMRHRYPHIYGYEREGSDCG